MKRPLRYSPGTDGTGGIAAATRRRASGRRRWLIAWVIAASAPITPTEPAAAQDDTVSVDRGGHLDEDRAVDSYGKPAPLVLRELLGIPEDLADVPGELGHLNATVRADTMDTSIVMLHPPGDVDALLAERAAALTERGWELSAPTGDAQRSEVSGSRVTTATVDDPLRRDELVVAVERQPDDRLAVVYTATTWLDGGGGDGHGTMFAAVTDARFDERLVLVRATLSTTLQPVTTSSVLGTRTLDPGVTFAAEFESPLEDAASLADTLESMCTAGRGYECLGPVNRVDDTHAAVEVRLPIGAEGELSVAALEDAGVTSTRFFLRFGLDAVVGIPSTGTQTTPDVDAGGTTTPAAVPGFDASAGDNPATGPPPTSPEPEPASSDAGPVDPMVAGGALAAVALASGALAMRRHRRSPSEAPHGAGPPGPARITGDDAPPAYQARDALAAATAHLPAEAATIATLDGSTLEILLPDAAERLPAPWAQSDVPGIWQLDLSTTSDEAFVAGDAPVVQIGDPSRGGCWVVATTRAVLELAGPPDRCWPLAQHVAARFLNNNHGARIDLLADEALPCDDPQATQLRWDNPSSWPDPSDRAGLLLVDATERETNDIDAAVERLAANYTALIIIGATVAGAVRVEVGDHGAFLPQFDLAITTTGEPSTAADEAVDPPVIEDIDAPTLRLLGPIRFEGVDVRPQQLSLLAYLSVHPGASSGAIQDALWATRAPTHKRFLNAVHELRHEVGSNVLPNSGPDGSYRLVGVTSDIDVAERLLQPIPDSARRRSSLEAFLSMVEGPPFTYDIRNRRHYRWVDLENHASRWEGIVADAAAELSAVALAGDDTNLSLWALQLGLLASPANERLTDLLATTYMRAGNEGAARTVLEAYQRINHDLEFDVGLTESSDKAS